MRYAAEILFARNKAYVESHREEFGEEPYWDDYETVQRECAEGPNGFVLTQQMFERRWLQLWKELAPHLILENMPQWAQELVEKIDPEGAAAARGKGPSRKSEPRKRES